MPVREVVLNRDARAPADLSPRLLRKRYVVRRVLSIVVLLAIDVGAMLLSAFVTLPLIESFTGLDSPTPGQAEIVAAVAITIFVFLLHGLYGRRSARRGTARILRAAAAERARTVYSWDAVTDAYERLAERYARHSRR